MTKLPPTRIVIALAVLVLFFVLLAAFLFITQLSFSVWEYLQQQPDWLTITYLAIIVFLTVLFGRIIWRLLLPQTEKPASAEAKKGGNNNIDAVSQRLQNLGQHDSTGTQTAEQQAFNQADKTVDDQAIERWAMAFDASPEVAAIRAELEEYGRRRIEQKLYIALFGDISAGKSSLVKALIQQDSEPLTEIETSIIGGTTREITHYHWQLKLDNSVHDLILTDMPGLNEQYAELDLLACEEVMRAHVVLYVCDGDLTASQFAELKRILLLHKPCIVVINKSDRLSDDERNLIITHMRNRLLDLDDQVQVVSISAGGLREYIRLTPDGGEERIERPVIPDVQALQEQLQILLQQYDSDRLEQLRESAVASMLNDKLDELELRFKKSQSHRLVKSYTRKAVVAAMATISPGTDLLVQGYLGIQMIRELCQLYGVPATDIDANKLIELVQSRMDKTMPLLLAIAGNGLKAFPGMGSVTGGLMHAVAYGMIFDTLGRSIARTLEVTGEFSPALVNDLYKEQLSEHIESRTKDFIRLVLKLRQKD